MEDGLRHAGQAGLSETPEIPLVAVPLGFGWRQDAEGMGSQASPWAGDI